MKKIKKSLTHDSSITHTRGESQFIDDIPAQAGEVFVVPVVSKVANGIIKKIDASKALEIDGVHAVYTAADLVENTWGPIIADQPIMAEGNVSYIGEIVAIVAASSREVAYSARREIVVEITELDPILSIEEAKSRKSFLGDSYNWEIGNFKEKKEKSKNTLKGVFINGGQEHFYLESQAVIVYPGENGDMKIISSSQHPTEVQHVVAKCLGLDYHQVVCTVKRMGGGFGGKESQASHIATLAALAAQKLGRSARLVLSKDDDMAITGKRHPFQNDYQVYFDDNGSIEALKVDFFADAGAYIDLTPAILQRAMFHVDNAYYLPSAQIKGTICKTNTASNTAFRGFGGPQGAAVIESIIEDIANHLGVDALEVRKNNLYSDERGLRTHYAQAVENNMLPQLFSTLEKTSEYKKRVLEIKKFNHENKYKVKGIALTGAKFGISFTTKFLNQANALINVHVDGTIQVSTGATEMGQGVNTKIQQIVSEVFDIDHRDIRLMPTSTEKNHNTSATAASSGSDLNGAAAQKAALKIKQRLAKVAIQYFNEKPLGDKGEYCGEVDIKCEQVEFKDGEVFDGVNKISFKELVKLCFFNRVSLGGYAHFKTPEIHFDVETGKGKPFLYFTNGACCSEVLIDCLTGETKVLKTDILMDLGRRINESIDKGQVAGAFVQSMGWCTTEELVYSSKGELLSHSPTTYKIPSIQDTPREFKIDFIENDTNIKNVRKSKAVGEPPFLLGLSVWNAIKSAISYKKGKLVKIKLPATSEQILLCLEDEQ